MIRAARRGVLIDVDESALVALACDAGGWIDVPHRIGTSYQLHHLLRLTAAANLPTGVVEDRDGEVRLVVATRRWEDYLSLSLDEIRVWGGGSLQVDHRMQGLLHDLLSLVDRPGATVCSASSRCSTPRPPPNSRR